MKRARFAPPGPLAIRPKAWGEPFDIFAMLEGDEPRAPFEREGDAAVVTICGPLMQHEDWLWDSYDAIRTRVLAALACAEARRVILKIDSPGGEAMGCLELAAELRAAAEAAGKELVAFSDGYAASAAYALATAAPRIVITPTACVGSVGCIQPLIDITAQDRMYGVAMTWLSTGERKKDGNPHIATSEGAVAEIQSQLDQLGAMFFALVEAHRGIPAAKVAALDGALVMGAKALGTGLADAVSTWGELIAATPTVTPSEEPSMSKYDEAMGALRAAAEADDEDGKKAKKAIKAIEDGDKPPEKTDEEKDKEAKAAAAKAEADDAEKKDKEMRAARAAGAQVSADPVVLELAAEVHALKAARADDLERQERAALLARRPDITGAVLEQLQTAPMAFVKRAVETWPVIASKAGALAKASAGAGVTGTRGDVDGEGTTLTDAEAVDLDRRMGLSQASGTIKREGRNQVFEVMTPEAARAHLAKNTPKAAAAATEGR